jgi:hypothetical protein
MSKPDTPDIVERTNLAVTEEWRPVVDWSAYEVSNFGRVRSVDRMVPNGHGYDYFMRGRLLTARKNPLGYCIVTLRHGSANSDLRAIEGYLHDADDDFDCTYADFHFAVPESFKAQVALLKDLGAVSNPSERWQTFLEDLHNRKDGSPEVTRALAVGERIFAKITESMKPSEEAK